MAPRKRCQYNLILKESMRDPSNVAEADKRASEAILRGEKACRFHIDSTPEGPEIWRRAIT